MRLRRAAICISLFSDFQRVEVQSVVALRIELSATRLSAGFGQPALDYQQPSTVALTGARAQGGSNSAITFQSGWPESNRHGRAPKARGLAVTQHPVVLFLHSVTRVGFEPNLFSLKD